MTSASPRAGGRLLRVAMLVQNDLEHDVRVRKEAESLAAHGLEVHVIGHAAAHLASHELVRGVTYHRLAVRQGLTSLGVWTPRARSHMVTGRSGRRQMPEDSLRGRMRERVVGAFSTVTRHTGWALTTRSLLKALKPDVVHAHDLDSLVAALWHIGRHPGVRFVYDAHELELHRNVRWTRFRRAIAHMIERRGIRRADAVLTVSPLIARDLASTYGVAAPTVLLNSPRLRCRDLEPALDLRHIASLTDADRLFVYVGGILWRRGHDQLVRALAHLPRSNHIGVLGPRDAAREQELLELAERLDVADRLHLFGPVPAEQVPATLRTGADATVIPIPNVCRSYDLALPNKLFDSVMAGLPVGVSRLTHMSEFVRGNEVGLVFDETDPRSIATTLSRLVAQPPVSPGRLKALQEHVAWDAQERALFGVYDRLGAAIGSLEESRSAKSSRS